MANLFIDVEFGGSLKAQAALRQAVDRQIDAYAAAVYLAVGNIMSTAERLTPVDTGFLRKTRYVTKPRILSSGRFVGTMGYSAPYALWVHERWAKHPAGEWKFLATAINYHAPSFLDDVARMIPRLAASGVTIEGVTTDHPTSPLIGPVPPRPKRRGRARARWEQKRATAFGQNKARVARESRGSLEAQRRGARLPRPGRR